MTDNMKLLFDSLTQTEGKLVDAFRSVNDALKSIERAKKRLCETIELYIDGTKLKGVCVNRVARMEDGTTVITYSTNNIFAMPGAGLDLPIGSTWHFGVVDKLGLFETRINGRYKIVSIDIGSHLFEYEIRLKEVA